jgi:hypothetical protein
LETLIAATLKFSKFETFLLRTSNHFSKKTANEHKLLKIIGCKKMHNQNRLTGIYKLDLKDTNNKETEKFKRKRSKKVNERTLHLSLFLNVFFTLLLREPVRQASQTRMNV